MTAAKIATEFQGCPPVAVAVAHEDHAGRLAPHGSILRIAP